MPTPCTRCNGTGFLNIGQVDDATLKLFGKLGDTDVIEAWIEHNTDHDVQICDCCGNGEYWYGTPGEHYNKEGPRGLDGPYAYNGGLCECN